MRSRLVMMLVIAAGFTLSTTGVGLAISGTSGSGNAAQNQYKHVSPDQNQGGKNGVSGVNLGSEEEPAQVEVQAAPVVEQQATTGSSGTLPFTGFLAIPLLIIGVGLLSLGAVIRRKTSQNGPVG
jgi:hypothetical protein